MPSKKCSLSISFLILFQGLVPAADLSAQELEPDTSGMRIGPGDVVRMAVRDEPALSGDFPVGE
ncbi:MAG: hypothetical protein GWM92_09415, partial [Gemmatimonadetes bacterium]|nr:hypothetical protein [Gemmatimonadota bacterium]NIR78868.1 hypothetical protein [Gemmatimonadota bacterium]NIT87513.1 hypothetical protein [Gemmatimonadota bacterium]NIU31381.1 hypothetical protein [Gemmatimonadota bacterium]NIU36056.1 hypothetical protein [Gemmatimonadota bacterium]